MPKELSPGKPTTRRYSQEEKAQAVRLVRQLRKELGTDHGTIQRVAEQLGIGVESVRSWVKQADVDDGVKPGLSSDDAVADQGARARGARVASSERDLEVGVGFLRGGARPPIEVIVAYIDEHRGEFGVEPICKVLQVAPSSYYAAKWRLIEPSARALRDAVSMPILLALWVANRKVYGAQKLW
jgi:transposase